MIYELWYSASDNSYSYFARAADYAEHLDKLLAASPDAELRWSFHAKSHFEAMRARNDFLGFEPYVPEPDWQDTFYD